MFCGCWFKLITSRECLCDCSIVGKLILPVDTFFFILLFCLLLLVLLLFATVFYTFKPNPSFTITTLFYTFIHTPLPTLLFYTFIHSFIQIPLIIHLYNSYCVLYLYFAPNSSRFIMTGNTNPPVILLSNKLMTINNINNLVPVKLDVDEMNYAS